MSSDLFLLDGSFFRHSPELGSSDFDFFADPFFPFSESPPPPPSDVLHHPVSNTASADQMFLPCDDSCVAVVPHLSSSPPSHQMRGLSLESSAAAPNGVVLNLRGSRRRSSSSSTSSPGVKSECLFDSVPFHSDKTALMQRSFSSQSLDRKPGLLFHPHFSTLSEGALPTTQVSNFNENCGFGGPIRRSSSTGDLQRLNRVQITQGSPLAHETTTPFVVDEITGFKVAGRYSAEERKQRIHRYRSKRTQRNFNKTIKYACRKTLADSRPRVRGRFARNDEVGETTKAASCRHREEEDEEELWNLDAFQEDDHQEGTSLGGAAGGSDVCMSSSFDSHEQQYFRYFGHLRCSSSSNFPPLI